MKKKYSKDTIFEYTLYQADRDTYCNSVLRKGPNVNIDLLKNSYLPVVSSKFTTVNSFDIIRSAQIIFEINNGITSKDIILLSVKKYEVDDINYPHRSASVSDIIEIKTPDETIILSVEGFGWRLISDETFEELKKK